MAIWKDVLGYEAYYEVSSDGEIRSKDRMKSVGGHPFLLRGKILSPGYSRGYKCFNLHGDGKKTHMELHRIIAITFIENPDNKPCVNHKNGIKTDNRIENLEWCSYKENVKHAFKMGLMKPWKGKKVIQYDMQGNVLQVWNNISEAVSKGFRHSGIYRSCHDQIKSY